MQYSRSAIFIIFINLSNIAFNSQGQAHSDAELKKVAIEIISTTQICTLITLDDKGNPRARAMDAFLPDEEFVIWFGTNPWSRKVVQIQHNRKVTLYYFDKPSASYVTIQGVAEIINNLKPKEKYWKKEWTSFYPNYPDGYVLIKVIPLSMEVVCEARGIIGDSITWQPQTVYFKR